MSASNLLSTKEPKMEVYRHLTGRDARLALTGKKLPDIPKVEIWLSVKEAARLMGLKSGDVIYRAIEHGELAYYRNGEHQTARVWIPYDEFDRWRKQKCTYHPAARPETSPA